MGTINNVAASVWSWGHHFRDALGRIARPRAEIEIMQLEELWRAINEGGGLSQSGVPVSISRAVQLSAVYACVRVIGESIAHLPLVLYRQEEFTTEDGLPMRRREADRGNPLYGLLHDRPNQWQTAFEFRELMQRDLSLRGNAYALIIRASLGGEVLELIRLHPDQIRVRQNADLTIAYDYQQRAGGLVTVPPEDMFHIRGLGDDGVTGLNPIAWQRETIGDALATREHGSRFYSNQAKPGGVLELDVGAKVQSETRKAILADFDEQYSGGPSAYKTAMLPPGVSFKQLTVNAEDAQFLENKKFQRSEIASIFRVPPHMIGDLDRATFSNIEQQSIEFVTFSLGSWLVRWEQAIERDLLDNDPARFVRHNVSALLRGEAKARAEKLQIERRNGVINGNEWRELEDRNPIDDPAMNEYIVERNMGPISETGQGNPTNDDT